MKKGELAKRLFKFRTAKKLTMTEVTRISMKKAKDHRGQITQSYLSRLESGIETNPSMFKILTICDIYSITPNKLIF